MRESAVREDRQDARTPRSLLAPWRLGGFLLSSLIVFAVLLSCSADDKKPDEKKPEHHRKITTSSEEAQRQFDRGLVFYYGFDHASAIACFTSASAADPECAMAFWGIALANGPHYNNMTLDEEHSKAAWEALDKARHLMGHTNDVERALILALWRRYSKDGTANRPAFDMQYAQAMRSVWEDDAKKTDPDVGTLFAESLMDLHPWDLWTDGKPGEDTEEIVATLEAVLKLQPDNPGANHLYIHAVEGSPDPHKADAAADRLRTLVPFVSHLLHMPSHIDARVGRWAQATDTNENAVAVDDRNAARTGRTSYYQLYMAHNRHFLAYSAMMEGRYALAIEAARSMVARFPSELRAAYPGDVDQYLAMPLHVLVRFGKWEEILKEPEPAEQLLVSRAVWHYARGVALAALSRLDEADKERAALDKLIEGVDDRRMGRNKAPSVLPIAAKIVAGEIAFRRGKTDEALQLMRDAVKLQDALGYDEPPAWMHPARHVLAATLLAAKKPEEAEKVLREDLEHLPENGWALTGLVTCLKQRGAAKELGEAQARLDRAWKRADTKISSPCLCQPGE